MENKDKPAYPVETHNEIHGGLTKREYMAAMAMQGLLAQTPTAESAKTVNRGVL